MGQQLDARRRVELGVGGVELADAVVELGEGGVVLGAVLADVERGEARARGDDGPDQAQDRAVGGRVRSRRTRTKLSLSR